VRIGHEAPVPLASSARARVLVLSSSALASTGGAAIKLCDLSALEVAGLRSGLAAIVLAVLLRPSRASWRPGALAVGVVQALMMIAFVTSNKLTTAASAIYLQSTAPLYVLVLAPLLLGEPVQRRDLGYLAVFALGLTAFFIGEEPAQPTAPAPLLGNLVSVAGGVGWALTILGLRWLAARPGHDSPSAEPSAGASGASGGETAYDVTADPAGAAVVLANVFVFVACLPWIAARPIHSEVNDWLVLAWLGVVQVGLAYVFLTRGARHLPAFEISLLLLVEPVLSPLWAWLVHGERVGAWAIAGGGAILAATAARSLRARR
jgi:drug/metabolite transporter, DME family